MAFASTLLLHGALLMVGGGLKPSPPEPEAQIAIRFASVEEREAPSLTPLEEVLPQEASPANVSDDRSYLREPVQRQEPNPVPESIPLPVPLAAAEPKEQAPARAPLQRAVPTTAAAYAAPRSAPPSAPPAAQQPHHEAGGRTQQGEASAATKPSPRMTDYLSAVRGMVENNREYPAMARQLGLQGTVTVRVSIRGDGSVGAVAVDVSSGHKALDKAAISAVKRSAPFKAPRGFGLDEVMVEIPIVYRLT